jgi:hypothetical protein
MACPLLQRVTNLYLLGFPDPFIIRYLFYWLDILDRDPFSSLIFLVPTCPIESKFLPKKIWTYYYYTYPKLNPNWTCNWYGSRCQSRLKVETRPTLRQFVKVSCTSKKIMMIPACKKILLFNKWWRYETLTINVVASVNFFARLIRAFTIGAVYPFRTSHELQVPNFRKFYYSKWEPLIAVFKSLPSNRTCCRGRHFGNS